MKSVFRYGFLFLAFCALGWPLVYYAYKFGTPEFGGLDVYSYYKLYNNWDFAAVDSPFNQRILSSYSIYLLHLSGLHYSTETAIKGLGLDPQVYFSALVFNFMCVAGTCVVIYKLVEEYITTNKIISFGAGLLFLLGFGTIFFLITALSDALGVFFVAVIFYFYLKKSYWLIPFLVLAILQREFIFFVFGLMAFIHCFADKANRKYYLAVLLVNIGCFLVYFILRKTVFFTPRYANQLDFSKFLHSIGNCVTDIKAFLRQVIMIQNLLAIYIVLCIYKLRKKMKIDKVYLWILLLVLGEVIALSLVISAGNNAGRFYYMISPIIIFCLVKELYPLLAGKTPEEKSV